VPLLSEYVLLDRTTTGKVALQVDLGQLRTNSSLGSSNPEIIVTDKTNITDKWTIFIDDGQIGFEATATIQDDQIVLQDMSNTDIWEIRILNGLLYIESQGIVFRTIAPSKMILSRISFDSVVFNKNYFKQLFTD